MAEIGQIARGVVVRLMPYGALVRLDDGCTGLVHISEIDDNFVRNVADYLEVEGRVLVKVLARKEAGKFEFSLKQARDADPEAVQEWEPAEPIAPPERFFDSRRETRAAFDDKMREFLNDSTERLGDLKRHHDMKLGRKGRA